MATPHRPTSIPAAPEQWSEKSKQSVSYHYKREYTDIEYSCWRCKTSCLFTAQDQKYTFEVKKASIDQRRFLCESCWSESHSIRTMIANCDAQWAALKANLQNDQEFLEQWLGLLIRLEEFVPYKPDTAKKNMLKKFISALPFVSAERLRTL
jgi:hypothetical protein